MLDKRADSSARQSTRSGGWSWRCVSFAASAVCVCLSLLPVLSGFAIPAAAYDLIFNGNFQVVTDAPASDAAAARFLTMATFGPTQAEITRLRGIGIGQWIQQQLAMPTTLERPYVENLDSAINNPGQKDRLEIWFDNSITAPDQLRQRVAWALSQIMVASDQGSETARRSDLARRVLRRPRARRVRLLRREQRVSQRHHQQSADRRHLQPGDGQDADVPSQRRSVPLKAPDCRRTKITRAK